MNKITLLLSHSVWSKVTHRVPVLVLRARTYSEPDNTALQSYALTSLCMVLSSFRVCNSFLSYRHHAVLKIHFLGTILTLLMWSSVTL